MNAKLKKFLNKPSREEVPKRLESEGSSRSSEGSIHPKAMILGVTLCVINKMYQQQVIKFAFLLLKGLYRDTKRGRGRRIPKSRRSASNIIFMSNRSSQSSERKKTISPEEKLAKVNFLTLLIHYKIVAQYRKFFCHLNQDLKKSRLQKIHDSIIQARNKRTNTKVLSKWKKSVTFKPISKVSDQKITYQVFQCIKKTAVYPEVIQKENPMIKFSMYFSHLPKDSPNKPPPKPWKAHAIKATPIHSSRENSPGKALKIAQNHNRGFFRNKRIEKLKIAINQSFFHTMHRILLQRKKQGFLSIKRKNLFEHIQNALIPLFNRLYLKESWRRLNREISLKKIAIGIQQIDALRAKKFKAIFFINLRRVPDYRKICWMVSSINKIRYRKHLQVLMVFWNNCKSIKKQNKKNLFALEFNIRKSYLRTVASAFAIWYTDLRFHKLKTRKPVCREKPRFKNPKSIHEYIDKIQPLSSRINTRSPFRSFS